jgi:predicted dehydrogenase
LRNLASLGVGPLLAYDPDHERSVNAADAVGAKPIARLEDAPPLRAVFICSPTSRHLEVAQCALERGAHLFIEKPISDTLKGVDELLARARRQNRLVMVAFNLRFHPCLQRIKSLLDDGAVGRILAARIQFGQYLPDWHPWEDYRQGYSANRILGGGIILDAVHEFDYARWLLGEVRAIAGMCTRSGILQIDTEDLAAFTLRHEADVISEIHLDYIQRFYARTCQVIGTEGTIGWDWSDKAVRYYSARTEFWEEFPQPEGYDENETYLEETRTFFAAIAGAGALPVDGESGARVLAIALAAKEAAATGRTVTL